MRLISAIGTPLTSDDQLDATGLETHLNAQWEAGIDGVLVAGTMGLMQLLPDRTWQLLAETASSLTRRGEVFIGAGDSSLSRTLARLQVLNQLKIDGAVVLTPYFLSFTQPELVDYYRRLADASTNPLYLYVNPGLTGCWLEIESIVSLAEHPNIAGVKCSCDLDWTHELRSAAPAGFRVIYAQAKQVDTLCRQGVSENLDGIFSVAPTWTAAIRNAAMAEDWQRAGEYQQRLTSLLEVVVEFGVFAACTVLWNATGVRGNFAPSPYLPLSEERRQELLQRPIVQQLLAGH